MDTNQTIIMKFSSLKYTICKHLCKFRMEYSNQNPLVCDLEGNVNRSS